MVLVPFRMPDVDRAFERFWRHYFLVSSLGPLARLDGYAQDYRHTLVYLVTKASRHYRAAREIALASRGQAPEDSSGQSILYIIEFPFEFEDCLNSTCRAMSMALSLDGAEHLAGRAAELQGCRQYQKIKQLRDMIEHFSPRVIHSRKAGKPIRLMPSDDCSRVQLGNAKIECSDVADVLNKLFDLASSMVTTWKSEFGGPDDKRGPFDIVARASVSVKLRDE